MNKILNLQLYVMVFFFIACLQISAIAATGTSKTLSTNDLKTVFSQLIDQNPQSTQSLDREIINFSSRPESIKLPPGKISYQIISKTKSKVTGHQIVWLQILVDGREQAKVKLSGDIQLFGDVVCLSRALKRHTIISPDDLEVMRYNISMLGTDFISDPALATGHELKATLQPGAILYGRLLKNPTMVKRGALVSILARSGSLEIKAAGQIRTAGALGDIVQVKNLMSRKEIYARVISPSEVQVDF